MSGEGPRAADLLLAALLVTLAVTAAVAFGVAVRRRLTTLSERPQTVMVASIAAPTAPIAFEAGVFHTVAAALALAPAAPRERSAHPRDRITYRFLRAFPGAPPRIPHPLTADEYRSGVCRTCHERGGYSPRFNAYVPLTPHAERGPCLQCHAGIDSVLGSAPPGADPSLRCRLCHANGGRPRMEVSTTWPGSAWPSLPRTVPDQLPPEIPHEIQGRENCLACHAGPAAVAEFRTAHPERTDCRQCHLALAPDAGAWVRSTIPTERANRGAK